MKKCFKCGEIKPPTAFNRHTVKPDGLQTRCRVCQNVTDRQLYKSSQQRKAKLLQRNSSRRKAKQALIKAYLLQHPCVDCGESDVIVLEFDHVRGCKLHNVCNMNYHSLASVMAEIAKCEVRCANCHKRATHQRRAH